jgi:arsenite methyltransferase
VSLLETSTCCTAFYEQDWVRLLTEGSFHPGGLALSRACVESMNLPRSARLLDLGSGVGATAHDLAEHSGLQVAGVDRSETNVARARKLAADRTTATSFQVADLGAPLPFPDQSFHGALAECVISLLPQPARTLDEIHRVLKKGGQLAITDMTVDNSLPPDLAEAVTPWTCLEGARSEANWRSLLGASKMRLEHVIDESQGLVSLLTNLKRRLLAAGAVGLLSKTDASTLPLEEIRHWLRRFEQAVEAGQIRYLRFHLVAPER